jgi:hypothetical protein
MKMKDKLEARKDLREMGLRQKVHPFIGENGKTYMLATCHMISNEDKINFFRVLTDVRVPDVYASNICQCGKT